MSNGEEVVSRDVDPPGADPKALLQRTALNLDEGNVVFGYGGNDGDCSDYQGTVVAAPENGGQPRFWQYQPAPPSSAGGAVWAPAGPSVDAAGNVYATTGNPDPPAGEPAMTFDDSDSVVKLDLAEDFVADPATELASPLGWFEPPNWEEESNNDLDLSSAAAELLPGGLLFQAGKDGVGYLIDEATMESGAPAVYSHPVCKEHSGFPGSAGGDSFRGGTIRHRQERRPKRSPTPNRPRPSPHCGKDQKTRSDRQSCQPAWFGRSPPAASAEKVPSSTAWTRPPAPPATPRRCRARRSTTSPPHRRPVDVCSWPPDAA